MRGRTGFARGFTCPALLGMPLGPFGISDTGLSPSLVPVSIGFSYPSVSTSWSRNPGGQVRRFGLFPFRSPLQGEFLFLRVLRCFTSPGWRRSPMDSDSVSGAWPPLGFPIRKSPDQSVFAAPRSLSQLAASFIARRCQGIRHAPFRAWPKNGWPIMS